MTGRSILNQQARWSVTVFTGCCIYIGQHKTSTIVAQRMYCNIVVQCSIVCIMHTWLGWVFRIHRVVVFIGVILYRTRLTLWKWVIVFMELLYSWGCCIQLVIMQFMVQVLVILCLLGAYSVYTPGIHRINDLYHNNKLMSLAQAVHYLVLQHIASCSRVAMSASNE